MKIEYLKISTGEDVLAQIESSDSSTFVLKNPMIFAISREGVGMMPYAPFAKDQKMTINKSHIVAYGEPDDEIKNAYNSKFGSGIVVASSGGIQIPQ
jgi:hypothetical protein